MNNNRYIYGSLTRTSDLPTTQSSCVVHPLKREEWATGDFVVGAYTGTGSPTDIVELATGRYARLMRNDLLVGALGIRRATLESVGDWHNIGVNGRMEDLTKSGFFGRERDHNIRIPDAPPFVYQGHVIRNGRKVCMQDFVPPLPETTPYTSPTIIILGTSMSVGKTSAARVIIHLLKRMGVANVVGTKLTGAGCYSDILNMHDAGADAVFDFVDAGLPSTVVPLEQFRESVHVLLSIVSSQHPDIVVAEVGASPFEAYNGAAALLKIAHRAEFVVLCASDPYAVLGISQTFGIQPDVVTGIATATSAGVNLVERLAGVPALNLCTEESVDELERLLRAALKDKVPLKT